MSFSYKELLEIYHNLSEFIREDIFNIHFAVVDVLLKNGIGNITPFLDEKDINKSNALLNNYIDGFIGQINESNIVKQIIELNPYNRKTYEFLIKEEGDSLNEIENLTNFLGYSMIDYKNKLLDEYVNYLTKDTELIDSDLSCEGMKEKYEKMKEKVEKYAKYIGCKDFNSFVNKLDVVCAL